MNIPTQTNDAEPGISPDSDEGSSCLSRRNVILGAVTVVAAISLPKNSLASTPLSMTDQPSKNNHGKYDNMNSTTDMPEAAQTFDPTNFTVVPARTFDDLRVGEIFRAPCRTLTDAHASAFQAVSADNHPIHYDVEYARRHGHTAPLVHGLQVLAFTAPGATLFPSNRMADESGPTAPAGVARRFTSRCQWLPRKQTIPGCSAIRHSAE
jgi:MaoC like domain